MLINDLKVVNNVAVRGVRLMEEFKDVLTDDEEQRRMLLHCIEDTRKLYPDFRKSTLVKTLNLSFPTVIVPFMTCRKRALSGMKTEEPERRATP